MNEKPHQNSQAFINQRKMAMVLPIFVLPVATLLFWMFGGGTQASTAQTTNQSGINTTVPEGQSDGIVSDKREAYNKAQQERERQNKMSSLDEYAFPEADTSSVINGSQSSSNIAVRKPINDPAVTELSGKVNRFYEKPTPAKSAKEEKMDRLLKMMEDKQATNGLTDEEYVNQELAKNPYTKYIERQMMAEDEKNRPAPAPEKRPVMEVSYDRQNRTVSALRQSDQDTTKKVNQGNSFYSTGNRGRARAGNTISAVIHQDQTIVDGATVKMRLLNDITVNGYLVPKNTFVYGIATLNSERLNLNITSVKYKNDILPVDLKVYDNDGIEGVSVPGSEARDAGKAALAQSAQGVGSGNYSVSVAQSVGQQMTMEAANAGLSAVKSLATKKARQIKVFVKANYRVYLK